LLTSPQYQQQQSQSRTSLTPEYSQNQKTRVVSTSKPTKGIKVPLQLIVILLLFVSSGIIGYLWQQGLLPIPKLALSSPIANPTGAAPSTPLDRTSGSQASSGNSNVNAAGVIQTNNEIQFMTTTTPPTQAIAPRGSVLQILKTQKRPENTWVYLRVCSIVGVASPLNSPSTSVAKKPLLSPGDEVRIAFSQLKSLNVPKAKPEVASLCQPLQDASIPAIKESSQEPKSTLPKQ
jgi:protein phosphatase